MADYIVTMAAKDSDGDILALCGSWGRREKAGAIADIESGGITYDAQAPGTEAARVETFVDTGRVKHLRPSRTGILATTSTTCRTVSVG